MSSLVLHVFTEGYLSEANENRVPYESRISIVTPRRIRKNARVIGESPRDVLDKSEWINWNANFVCSLGRFQHQRRDVGCNDGYKKCLAIHRRRSFVYSSGCDAVIN